MSHIDSSTSLISSQVAFGYVNLNDSQPIDVRQPGSHQELGCQNPSSHPELGCQDPRQPRQPQSANIELKRDVLQQVMEEVAVEQNLVNDLD